MPLRLGKQRHSQPHSRRLIRLVLVGSVGSCLALLSPVFLAAQGSEGKAEQPKAHQEFQEDGPAPLERIAAPTGTALAPRPRAGSYESVQVNVAGDGSNILGDAANEPSLAIDPTNPNRIVVGWRQFDSVSSNFRQAGWAYSHDGGETWTFDDVLEPGGFRSDPVLAADAQGRFYYYSLKSDFTADVWRSDDGGLSWLPPVNAFGADKIAIATDPNGDHVYVSWGGSLGCSACGDNCCSGPICCTGDSCCSSTVCCDARKISRSVDRGASFEEPILGTPEGFAGGTFTNLAVGPEGELYLTGLSVDAASVLRGYGVFRSDNAGDPLAAPTFRGGLVDLGGAIPLFALPVNPAGSSAQPEIVVDHSAGSSRGNVYLLSSVDPPGADPLDLHFARSTDGGITWSTPIRVNDDDSDNGAYQWFGTFSAAPNGRLDAIWNDTRNSDQVEVSELFYAYSWDGGETWSENTAVSPPWNSLVGFPNQNKIGDYYDIISDEDGAAVAYAATFNGEQDIFFLRVFPDCDGNGRPDAADIRLGARDRDHNQVPDVCQPPKLEAPQPGEAGTFNTFRVSGTVAGSRIKILNSFQLGTGRFGRCRNLGLGGRPIRSLGTLRIDAEGNGTLRRNISHHFSGHTIYYQAIDLRTCAASNVLEVTYP